MFKHPFVLFLHTVVGIEVAVSDFCGNAVVLIVDFAPQQVFQLGEAHSGNRGDKHRLHAVGQFTAHFVHQLIVEHVALGDSKHTRLVGKVGVETLQFVAKNFIFAANVVAVGRNHKQQHGIALNVAKETQSQTLSLACTLDDAGNVGHHKRAVVAVANDAKVRLESGEWIVGDFRLCSRY